MKRILIIDEENISVRGVKNVIETKLNNTNTYHCKTCASALLELEVNSYNLIILDMMLPTGDWSIAFERPDNTYGIDLLEEIRKRLPKIPVICYTIMNDTQIIDRIQKLGAIHICKLSFNSREDLVKSIKLMMH